MTKTRTKKSAGKVQVFTDDLETLVAQIRAKYGEGSVVRGNEMAQVQTHRIPFGVFNLDAAIGGGLPKGRVTLIRGEFSSTKTTLALKACAQAQRLCRFCHGRFRFTLALNGQIKVQKPCACGKNQPHIVVYLDVEGTMDLAYARLLGFNPEIALLIQPDYAEQGIDVADSLVRSGEADVIVIDSIAALTPTTEIEESAEKWQQGLQARLINKFMRKLVSALNSLGATTTQKPAIIVINQKREKIGVLYGDPTTVPGGKGQQYTAAIYLDLRAGKVIRVDESGKEMETKGEVVGLNVFWKVLKNKVSGGQGRSGEFKYYTLTAPKLGVRTGQVNNAEQIIGFGKLFGLVDAGGGGTLSYGGVKARGVPIFEAMLRKQKLWKRLQQEVTQTYLAQSIIADEGDE